MKRTITYLASSLISLLLIISCGNNEFTTVITGEVLGRDSDTLILKKYSEDLRFEKFYIPIIDNKFEYTVTASEVEAYEFIFKEEFDRLYFAPIYIFPEKGKIHCVLHSEDSSKFNVIKGGPLNEEFSKFNLAQKTMFFARLEDLENQVSNLSNEGMYFSEGYQSAQKSLRNSINQKERTGIMNTLRDLRNSGNHLSSEGMAIEEKMRTLFTKMVKWKYGYIENKPSEISYFLLLHDYKVENQQQLGYFDMELIMENVNKHLELFPNHPYTQLFQMMLDAQDVIVGNKYINVSATNLGGKLAPISDIIEGSVSLIDLWATWCSPCISNSRSLVPVYEEFKEMGFKIVGIAREVDDTDQLIKTLEREQFPWVNMVEINNEFQIWVRYGLPDSGGGTFLVDKDGTILAINPSADQVREILTEKLGSSGI